ncbi:hypothetical protein FB451DRAFT_1186517 [Mycena latifolia]|nr:hypothetical protein FB451DRAFT_1186517 [Mycena latifolia]
MSSLDSRPGVKADSDSDAPRPPRDGFAGTWELKQDASIKSTTTSEVPNIEALVHIREHARWESAQGCECRHYSSRNWTLAGVAVTNAEKDLHIQNSSAEKKSVFQLAYHMGEKLECPRRSKLERPKTEDEVVGVSLRGPELRRRGKQCRAVIIGSNRNGQLEIKRVPRITQMKTLTTPNINRSGEKTPLLLTMIFWLDISDDGKIFGAEGYASCFQVVMGWPIRDAGPDIAKKNPCVIETSKLRRMNIIWEI